MAGFIELKDLKTYFKVPNGTVHAVDGVNLDIDKGRTIGIVGESGCGKTTLGRTILHLERATDGKIYYLGRDITNISSRELRELRKDFQLIFQDPYSSLNPRMTVEATIQEPLKLSKKYSNAELEDATNELMERVGIDQRLRLSYPHELDGGRRQRVVIARALAMDPKFIVCDEPVSALDVSIQAQVLNLLQDLKEDMHLTYMFITHDLSVVRHISDDICVMYMGQAVEKCDTRGIFSNPMHPYTKALLSAIPSTDIHHRKKRIVLQGEVTSPIDPKPGCRFAARCPYADEACELPQSLEEVKPGHLCACCHVREINS